MWPGALFTFLHCIVMKKRQILHIFEMLTATLLFAQGTWFWQVKDISVAVYIAIFFIDLRLNALEIGQ